MNKVRRKNLQSVYDRLEGLKERLEELQGEEEECCDNIPENMRASERYERSDNACYCIDEAVRQLDEAMDNIMSAIEG